MQWGVGSDTASALLVIVNTAPPWAWRFGVFDKVQCKNKTGSSSILQAQSHRDPNCTEWISLTNQRSIKAAALLRHPTWYSGTQHVPDGEVLSPNAATAAVWRSWEWSVSLWGIICDFFLLACTFRPEAGENTQPLIMSLTASPSDRLLTFPRRLAH